MVDVRRAIRCQHHFIHPFEENNGEISGIWEGIEFLM